MQFPSKDWKWASITAGVLTASAIAVVFGLHPGGFEGQGAWYLVLLPFGILASFAADLVPIRHSDTILFWPLLIAFNFSWYCLVSLAVVKVHRFLR